MPPLHVQVSLSCILPPPASVQCRTSIHSSVAQFLNPHKAVGDYRSLQSMAIFLEEILEESDGSGFEWSSETETDAETDGEEDPLGGGDENL